MITEDSFVTIPEMSLKTGVATRTIKRDIEYLQQKGVPTIQEKLADNGSPRATFETTEDRLTFLIHIPIHAGCGNKSRYGENYGDYYGEKCHRFGGK